MGRPLVLAASLALGVVAGNARTAEVAPAAAGQLGSQVERLERRLEKDFRRAGTVTSVLYAAPAVPAVPNDERVADLTDYGDSALWTGVYLASLCFRQAVEPGAEVASRVTAVMDALDALFEVTGDPGYMARFAFAPTMPGLRGLALAKVDPARTPGWTASPVRPGWGYIGPTSRDQYTGLMFGLGVCRGLTRDPAVRARADARIASTVRILRDRQWSLPCGGCVKKGTAGQVLDLTQMAWLHLASLGSPAEFAADYEKSRRAVERSWADALNPTEYNTYLEYYAFNLGYLRHYTFFAFEPEAAKKAKLRARFLDKIWGLTWEHHNAMFAFMKLGALGPDGKPERDARALAEGRRSLEKLSERVRRDFPVVNSTRADIGRRALPRAIGGVLNRLGVAKFERAQADRPLPIEERPYEDFYWQRTPFRLDGAGDGRTGSPAVDVILAYWLGRFHGLVGAGE